MRGIPGFVPRSLLQVHFLQQSSKRVRLIDSIGIKFCDTVSFLCLLGDGDVCHNQDQRAHSSGLVEESSLVPICSSVIRQIHLTHHVEVLRKYQVLISNYL